MDSTTLKAGRAPTDLRPHARAFLVVQYGDAARMAPIAPSVARVVGRGEGADVSVPDPSLSRRHARLELDGDGLVVTDLGSRNGTVVAGARVESARVRAGEPILLGDTVVCLHRVDAPQELPAGVGGEDALLAILEHECARCRWLGRALAVMLVRGAGEESPLAGRFLPAMQAVLRPPDRTSLHGRHAVLVVVPEHADPAGLARDVVAAAGRAGTSVSVGVAPFPAAGTTPHALIEAARQAAELARPAEVAIAVGSRESTPGTDDAPVVASEAMEGLLAAARRVAAHVVPVLLTGETGTGKEVLARRIHVFSGRAAEPFRAVNCGSIPQTLLESTLFGHEKGAFTGADRRRLGIFEVAHKGTLFLDEIGELSPPAQASLLRAIETGKITRVGGSDEIDVDVRLLAATHRDLERMCERGDFRWDLLYRLNTVVLEVPPLRDRLDEIEPLARRFLDEVAARAGGGAMRIGPEALAALRAYHWPGNVRELRNVIERAVVMTTSGEIRPEDLPPRVRQPRLPAPPPAGEPEPPAAEATEAGDLRDKLSAYERRLILAALEQAGGNQSEAARRLGVPRRTLSSKLAAYGIRKRFDTDG